MKIAKVTALVLAGTAFAASGNLVFSESLGVGVGIGGSKGVNVGVGLGIGGDEGVKAGVGATVGGDKGLKAGAGATVGGDKGLKAGAGATVGGDKGLKAGAGAAVGGDKGVSVGVDANVGNSGNGNAGNNPALEDLSKIDPEVLKASFSEISDKDMFVLKKECKDVLANPTASTAGILDVCRILASL